MIHDIMKVITLTSVDKSMPLGNSGLALILCSITVAFVLSYATCRLVFSQHTDPWILACFRHKLWVIHFIRYCPWTPQVGVSLHKFAAHFARSRRFVTSTLKIMTKLLPVSVFCPYTYLVLKIVAPPWGRLGDGHSAITATVAKRVKQHRCRRAAPELGACAVVLSIILQLRPHVGDGTQSWCYMKANVTTPTHNTQSCPAPRRAHQDTG